MLFRYSLSTIDAITHLNGVQINFHDALFRPQQFDKGSEIDLEAFTYPATTRPEEYILGCLLGDGRGTEFLFLRMLTVPFRCMFNGLIIKAVMLHESTILTGYDGNR